MKTLLSLLAIGMVQPARAEMITVNANRVCAAIVGIPYASDNFTEKEWGEFQDCHRFLNYFDNVE
jgi:hypothetical protein